jgi:GNAT superfamily N-acetyltransferase
MALTIRDLAVDDFAGWKPLWDGYNAFYGRKGETSLVPDITQATWQRFLDPAQPLYALVATLDDRIDGLTHYVVHPSTSRLEPVCYLQDLFTVESERGRGIGRALIEAVYERARGLGIRRVYWHTQESNAAGRALYEKMAKHSGFIVYSREV